MEATSGNIDLKELERKAMSSFNEDGIIDIILGILGVLWGFSALTNDSYSMSVIWIAVIFPSYWAMKRQYTIPRIGMVRFSKQPTHGEQPARIILTATLGAIVAAGLVIWWTSAQATKPSYYYYTITSHWAVMLGVLLAALGAVFARVAYLPRFYAYSALALLVVSSAQYLGLPFGYHLLTLGGAVLVNGGILLYRFTNKYPVEEAAKQDA